MSLVKKETGTFKSFDGTKIYYELRGEGPPIVMAYGIGCLINHWQHQVKAFSNKYQVIVFDYRAHHQSDIPEDREQLTIDALARDVQALMQHLGLVQASFWGHSFGTQVLIRAYDLFPEMFHSLVFVNGFASNPLKGMFGNDAAMTFFQMLKSGYSSLPETIRHIWKLAVNNPLAIQLSALAGGFNIHLTHLKDIEIYARGIASMDLDCFITLFEQMINYDGRPVYDRIVVPTLIIGGTKDSITPEKYQENMYKKIKSSQLLMVPYGSHCTQLDMPDYVNLRIEKFLKTLNYS